MGLKARLKKLVSFVLHGEPNPIYANISYLSPNDTLRGKKVIITGGGRGLGFSIAKKFVSEGADVLISGRNTKVLEESAKLLGCKYLQLDVSKPSEFDSFMKNAYNLLDGMNVLVNNAGISLHENSFFDVTPDTFDAQYDTNLKGPFFLTQSFIRQIREYGTTKASVLFVSSETGETMDFRPYGFTKASINSMVKGLAYLFAHDGIRINAVAPGITASDMTGLSSEGNISYNGNICGRVYMPEEVAETAAFLVSDAADCLSGQIITCNNAKTVNARWK